MAREIITSRIENGLIDDTIPEIAELEDEDHYGGDAGTPR